jgi:hypothetical protein
VSPTWPSSRRRSKSSSRIESPVSRVSVGGVAWFPRSVVGSSTRVVGEAAPSEPEFLLYVACAAACCAPALTFPICEDSRSRHCAYSPLLFAQKKSVSRSPVCAELQALSL